MTSRERETLLAFVSDRAGSFIRVRTTLDIEGADEDASRALDDDDDVALVVSVLRMYTRYAPDPRDAETLNRVLARFGEMWPPSQTAG